MITKDILDLRICDVEKEADNTQTFREYIRETEDYMGLREKDLDNLTDKELNEYIDFLDYLWEK